MNDTACDIMPTETSDSYAEHGKGFNEDADFQIPDQIQTCHPWVSRLATSIITKNTVGSDLTSTVDKEVYGSHINPIAFRIGNGGAGYTGILKALCLKFISNHGASFRISWVANRSRYTQVALLADIVQVALTYEPELEELTVEEGWCRRVCAPAFWDHFILAGPSSNPAGITPGGDWNGAFKQIAKLGSLFNTRGDGSATFEKEQKLWKEAHVDPSSASWLQTQTLTPYSALLRAEQDGAYLLTDRANFLTAKKDGTIPDLKVYIEGGEQLLNPCSALINTKVADSPSQRLAIQFAEWLAGDDAQSLIRGYGRVWEQGKPLFTGAKQAEFGDDEYLAGENL